MFLPYRHLGLSSIRNPVSKIHAVILLATLTLASQMNSKCMDDKVSIHEHIHVTSDGNVGRRMEFPILVCFEVIFCNAC
jgi:hypothetical protein